MSEIFSLLITAQYLGTAVFPLMYRPERDDDKRM